MCQMDNFQITKTQDMSVAQIVVVMEDEQDVQ